MSKGIVLRGREQRMVWDLHEALGASLDLHAVLKDAYRLLLPLVGADYGALAATPSDGTGEYEWIVQDLPPAFLGSYQEMAPHDFVHSSVLAKINVVVRDSEMIDRRALERNMMYHRAREVGSPLEQVMAVMLHAGGGLQSGLSLYRDRPRPFSEREQGILQQLTPAIANAVRNCRSYAKEMRSGTVLEILLGSARSAVVVVRPPARELERTALATALLDTWFTPVERSVGGLPWVLLDELAQAQVASTRGGRVSRHWKRPGERSTLQVEVRPLPDAVGAPLWALMLNEVPDTPPVPVAWQARLTKTQTKVVAGVLRGRDNQFIADELGCKPSTVKVHLKNIFDKLGVPSRKMLMYLATREA